MDFNLVQSLQSDAIADLNLKRFLIPFGFSLHPIFSITERTIRTLELLLNRDEENEFWALATFEISRKKDRFATASPVLKQFVSKLELKDDSFQAITIAMELFIREYAVQSSIDQTLQQSLSSEPALAVLTAPDSAETLRAIRHRSSLNLSQLENFWKSFTHTLHYSQSPFFTDADAPVYGRSSRFDRHLRPTVLVRKTQPKLHIESSASPDPSALWTHPCERITPNSREDGLFSVLASGWAFASTSSKRISIPNSLVTHLFHANYNGVPDSVQIFTADHRGFLFRFPGERSHDFVRELRRTELPAGAFIQEGEALHELRHMDRLLQWQSGGMPTLDFLLWVNYVSGRSFLSPASPPTFPSGDLDFCGDPGNLRRHRTALEADTDKIPAFLGRCFPSIFEDAPSTVTVLESVEAPPIVLRLPAPAVKVRGRPGSIMALLANRSVVEAIIETGAISVIERLDRPATAFTFCEGGFAFSDHRLCMVDGGKASAAPHSDVSFAFEGGRGLVTASRDGCVTEWQREGAVLVPLETSVGHEGAIVCAALSTDMGVFATAGIDRRLALWLLPRLRWLRGFTLSLDPKKVEMCSSGIIVVMGPCGDFVCVGVNGQMVREVTLMGVVDFCAAEGRNGIDWLIICGVTGDIGVVDPVSLEMVRLIHRWPGVKTVEWDPALRAVLATTPEPEVVIIQIELR
jgi:hypothetical protein